MDHGALHQEQPDLELPSHSTQWNPNNVNKYDGANGVGIAYPDIAGYGRGVSLGQVDNPSETVWFADSIDQWLDTDGWGSHIADRHNEMANILFFDGHAKAMKKTGLRDNRYWPDY